LYFEVRNWIRARALALQVDQDRANIALDGDEPSVLTGALAAPQNSIHLAGGARKRCSPALGACKWTRPPPREPARETHFLAASDGQSSGGGGGDQRIWLRRPRGAGWRG